MRCNDDMCWRTFHYARILITVGLIAGCNKPEPTVTINDPPGKNEDANQVAKFMANQRDQGMIDDMAITDIHFRGSSRFLSGAGEARLERYAELLATTGGKLHYDTRLTDLNLVDARLRSARDFLNQARIGSQSIQLVLGKQHGRGMDASESIAGQAVAKQPEQRARAYNLAEDAGN